MLFCIIGCLFWQYPKSVLFEQHLFKDSKQAHAIANKREDQQKKKWPLVRLTQQFETPLYGSLSAKIQEKFSSALKVNE